MEDRKGEWRRGREGGGEEGRVEDRGREGVEERKGGCGGEEGRVEEGKKVRDKVEN